MIPRPSALVPPDLDIWDTWPVREQDGATTVGGTPALTLSLDPHGTASTPRGAEVSGQSTMD